MFSRVSILICLFFLSTTLFAASDKTMHYTFTTDSQNWVGDFTDYPKGKEHFFELAWGWENIPSKNFNTKGIFLAGNNHSDDLFMYIKNRVSNLKPNTAYAVSFSVNLATNIPVGSFGIGGSPGESVALKVGAATVEPNKIARDGFYILNVDKGNQSQGGKNAVVVGNLANPLVDQNNKQYMSKQVANHENPIIVNSDETGNIWVFVGSDSGFEGLSKYYINEITITFHETNNVKVK